MDISHPTMADFSEFIPSAISKTMRDSYEAFPKLALDVQSTPYHDDENPSAYSSSTPSLYPRYEKVRLLKQCFVWLTISVLFIFVSTTIIVLTGTYQIRNPSNLAQKSTAHRVQRLELDKERQEALAMLPSPSHPPKNAKSCGPDAATAIAKGCHLDMISFTWLPHECYDAELTADFLSLSPWQWSLDQNGTELVTQEQVEVGEVDNGWVTWEYHLTHCLYTWKKLMRHLEKGGAMDWYVMEYSHARHCGGLLLQEGVDRREFNSEFFVQFPLCGYA